MSRTSGTTEPAAVELALEPAQIEALVCYLLRKRSVFDEAIGLLEPLLFNRPQEYGYAALWQCAVDFYYRYHALAPVHALRAEFEAAATARPYEILPEVAQFLLGPQGLLSYVFTIPEEQLEESYGLVLLRRFLEERTVIDAFRAKAREFGGLLPTDLPEVLRGLSLQLDRVRGVSLPAGSTAFEEDPSVLEADRQRSLTGNGFIDSVTSGGVAAGEVTLLCGTTGSGKTYLASSMAGKMAVAESTLAMSTERPARWVCYFTYETAPAEVKRRAISHLARVTNERLLLRPWVDHLSAPERGRELLAYELSPAVQQARADGTYSHVGELARLERLQPFLANFRVFDQRGPRHDPTAGSGYVEEIRTRVDRLVRHSGRGVHLVVVDFVQEMCGRYCQGRGDMDRDPQARLRVMTEFCNEVRRQVGDPYGCAILALVQLSGTANSRSPTAKQSPSDAMWCRTMHINADWTFQLGNKHRRSQCCLLWSGKTRHTSGGDEESILLRFRSEWDDLYPASDWAVAHGDIIQRAAQGMVADPVQERRRSAGPDIASGL